MLCRSMTTCALGLVMTGMCSRMTLWVPKTCATRAVSLLGVSRREWWWKDAEILMLRHQLAVAQRERPRAHSRLTCPDRAWLALLAGTVPAERLAALRLIVTPGTILRWQRDIVCRRWARRSGRSGGRARPGLGRA